MPKVGRQNHNIVKIKIQYYSCYVMSHIDPKEVNSREPQQIIMLILVLVT